MDNFYNELKKLKEEIEKKESEGVSVSKDEIIKKVIVLAGSLGKFINYRIAEKEWEKISSAKEQ